MNLLFQTAKPRRFNHAMVFYDERRERLRMIEARAKSELGMMSESQCDERCLADRPIFVRRVGKRKSTLLMSCLAVVVLLLALLLLCLMPWL